MRLILTFIFILSLQAQAKCDYYSNVPKKVSGSVGDLKGVATSDVEMKLQNTFKKVIGEFAKVEKVNVNFQNFDGKYLNYKVSQTDQMWNAKGGSRYIVSVNTSTGLSKVKFLNCWDN